jgi:CheY-like chemotaxis protein/VanZ family protein
MSGKKRILIIDDEKSICDMVKKGLELMGDFEVSIETRGKGGIRAAKWLRPDLILLDICMPGMDGLEVLKRLKENNKDTITIPVIMLTAVSDGSTKEECARLYDEMYIEKPVEIIVLKAKIDEVLIRRQGPDSLPILHSPMHSKTMHGDKRLKRAIRFWIPVFLWAAVISCLSSIPAEYFPQIPVQHVDKIVHFIEYTVLGWLLIRAFKHSRPGVGDVMLVAVSIILITAFAMSDEWHQTFLPGRVGDFSDVVLDTISSGIGIFFYLTGRIRSKNGTQEDDTCNR